MTELKVTGEIINDTKDKKYWLYCWRLNKNIDNIRQYASFIVTGKLTKDNNSCAVIRGMRWLK